MDTGDLAEDEKVILQPLKRAHDGTPSAATDTPATHYDKDLHCFNAKDEVSSQSTLVGKRAKY